MVSKEPREIKGAKIAPRDLILDLLEVKPSRDQKTAKPDDHKFLQVIAKGTKGGRNVTWELESVMHPYYKWNMNMGVFTVGFPAAVTCRMLGNGQVKEKGFFTGESVLDPMIYFGELKRRDITFTAKMIEEL